MRVAARIAARQGEGAFSECNDPGFRCARPGDEKMGGLEAALFPCRDNAGQRLCASFRPSELKRAFCSPDSEA